MPLPPRAARCLGTGQLYRETLPDRVLTHAIYILMSYLATLKATSMVEFSYEFPAPFTAISVGRSLFSYILFLVAVGAIYPDRYAFVD